MKILNFQQMFFKCDVTNETCIYVAGVRNGNLHKK